MSRDREKVELNEATDADTEFLYAVYAAARADEVKDFGWEASQAEEFLKMQFDVRSRSYAMQYPGAATSVVLYNGTPAGSMIVDRSDEQVSLTDIAILPAFRQKGIATSLIRDLQKEAAANDKPVRLSVDKNNPSAFRLYGALGFVVTNEGDLNYSMQWTR